MADVADLLRRRRELDAERAQLDALLGAVRPPPARVAPGGPRFAAVLFLAVLAGGGGWLVYRGGVAKHLWAPVAPAGPRVTPVPAPPVPVPAPAVPGDAGPIRAAAAAYRAGFAKAHGALADQVESGEVATLDQLVGLVKLARGQAAGPLAKLQDDYVRSHCDPQGNITDRKAVAGALRAVQAGLGGD